MAASSDDSNQFPSLQTRQAVPDLVWMISLAFGQIRYIKSGMGALTNEDIAERKRMVCIWT